MFGAGLGELSILAGVVLSLVLQLAMVLALFAWARRVARRHASPRWAQLAWLPIAGGLLWLLAGAVGASLLSAAFAATSTAPPETRALLLADGIAEAMNTSAALGGLGAAAIVASVVLSLVGTLRPPTRRDPGKEEGAEASGDEGPCSRA